MSFAEEVFILRPEEIERDKDVVIEDRMLVAVGSQNETRLSNTAQKTSFYSKLIEVCADKLRAQGNWELERLMRAAENMVDIVVKQRRGRFVWLKQLPVRQYVALTRKLAIDKLANDLKCQMRKLEAAHRHKDVAAVQQRQVPETRQMKYAVQLIYTVCKGLQAGLSPVQAARILDHPPKQHVLPLTSVETNNGGSASNELHQESARERSLRLLLRKRFFAAVRANTSLFVFSKTLLDAWGVPVPGFDPKNKKKKKKSSGGGANVMSERSRSEHEHTVHGFPPSLSIVVPRSNGASAPAKSTKACKPKVPATPKVLWTLPERKLFLTGFQQFGVGFWKEIAPSIPSRSPVQVSAYGRYMCQKFKLKKGDFPNEEVRNYLLREGN